MMKVIGVIAEYNPFHNGHLYHINKIKEMYPNSLVIAIINGYFMQRGELSVLCKEDKVKIALNHKIDIVLELPFVYGTQSGDIFGYYAVKILSEFKIDILCFGSESNNVDLLEKVVDIELNDPSYEERVKEYLETGINYPTALAKALNIKENITNPNDLLGISYIKAIKKINDKIKPVSILRTSDYHDIDSNEEIISAQNIRNKIVNEDKIDKYVPSDVVDSIIRINKEDIFDLLKFKILTDKDLSIYLDVDEGLDYRILKFIKISNSYEELMLNLKTKRYTYNKLNRMLMHILVGLTKKDNVDIRLDYIKILGFNKNGQDYIKSIRKDIIIPTRPNKDSLLYKYELLAAYIYEQITKKKVYDYDYKNIPSQKEDL